MTAIENADVRNTLPPAATDGSADAFHGTEQRRVLSQHLMDWYEQPVSDTEVAGALGAESVLAFRYAQSRLEGRVRNVTLEPAFCHSADVALRAAELGFPPVVLQAALLHDVVEDLSKTAAELARNTDELRSRFDATVAQAAVLLTNRYRTLFQTVNQKLRPDLPFDSRSGRAFRAALEALRWELPSETADRFAPELKRLATFFDNEADFQQGAHIVKRDKKYTLSISIERQVYRVYVRDLAAQAVTGAEWRFDSPAVVALVVKLFDTTDNIRTSEVSNRLSLFKLMSKAESLLDACRQELANGPKERLEATAIPALARLLELRLVDQIETRHRAIRLHFAETRFAGLLGFLAEHARRLAEKYQVGDDRLHDIARLEEVVRSLVA